ALERPLVQERKDRLIRLDRFQVSERFPHDLTRGYRLDLPAVGSGEIFRGVSSVLALSATKLLVLERSARIEGGGIGYGGAIYQADCEKDPCRKTKIFDLMTGLKTLRGGKNIPNFEGLSWGPALIEGRRTVLLVSDNNFSEKTGSEIIAFLVKDAP
ncbi:MAG TPA: esterase-like activity of phytase family protein, partial [Pseudobdellovibrionaceae bacterium]|nr:esterase-like activity of phytase family protein [Pseudobdellovibrionaceae bacterium]